MMKIFAFGAAAMVVVILAFFVFAMLDRSQRRAGCVRYGAGSYEECVARFR